MNTNHTPHDLLDRAETALRELPADVGPSSSTLDRIAALATTAEGQPPLVAPPVFPPHLGRKVIGVLLTSAALVLAIYGLTSSPTISFAFEDVVTAIRKAETVSYLSVIVSKEGAPLKVKTLHKGSQTRTEHPDGSYSVMDMTGMRSLMVQPQTKTATLMKLGTKSVNTPSMTDSIINWLRTAETSGKPVGEKVIDGVRTLGFEAQFGPTTMTIWGDPKTKLPVQIDAEFGSKAEPLQVTMRDFAFNASLDDALFSTEAPAGYKVEEHTQPEVDVQALVKLPPEEHVVRILKFYSGLFDGAFPERIDGPVLIAKISSKAGNRMQEPEFKKEFTTLTASMGAAWTFRQSLSKFGYVGTAKRNDKDSIVFWYLPKDADQYRVVYADLTVGNVPADKIPKESMK